MSSVCGIGVDLIEIARVKKAHEKWGKALLVKLYRPEEIDYCMSKHNPYPSLAARFAAKEAGFKALSQAGVHVVLWRSIWVKRLPWQAPVLQVDVPHDFQLHLTISHSKEIAIAMVVAERD